MLRFEGNPINSDFCSHTASGHAGHAAEQRDELTPSKLIEWHFALPSRGRTYRIGSDQSAGAVCAMSAAHQ
jgi:hypothetical protein